MAIRWKEFRMQKVGNQPNESEDCTAVNGERLKFAIADGVGESIFPQQWAQILSSHFVEEVFSIFEDDVWNSFAKNQFFEHAKTAWRELIPEELTFYAKEKVVDGSSSTLMGVELHDSRQVNGKFAWRAIGVGDSCLFHVGETRKIIRSFPLIESQAFSNFPDSICSVEEIAESILKRAEGWLAPGESLLLATDSLSQWLLRQDETGGTGVEVLPALADAEKRIFLTDQVKMGKIKNDDISLLRIENQSG